MVAGTRLFLYKHTRALLRCTVYFFFFLAKFVVERTRKGHRPNFRLKNPYKTIQSATYVWCTSSSSSSDLPTLPTYSARAHNLSHTHISTNTHSCKSMKNSAVWTNSSKLLFLLNSRISNQNRIVFCMSHHGQCYKYTSSLHTEALIEVDRVGYH